MRCPEYWAGASSGPGTEGGFPVTTGIRSNLGCTNKSDHMFCFLIQWFSKWGPQISSINNIWERVIQANIQAPSEMYYIRNTGERAVIHILTRIPGDSDACSILRITGLICRRKVVFLQPNPPHSNFSLR